MLCGIGGEHGLCRQHLQEARQTTLERDFARSAAFMRFPAAQLGQQLHFFPAQAGFQEFETVLHTPALPIHGKDAHGTLRIGDRPIGEQQPRLPVYSEHAYLHQPHLAGD